VRVLTEGPPVVAVVAGLSALRPGDRILATNGKRVETAADVLRILSLGLEPLRVEVEVLRGEKRLIVRVPR
jgi:S1-C subfamily serine protease